MVVCSVCGERNDDLAITCSHCGSYLQAKVDVLDLFSTLWGLMESPRRTFRRIVLSRRKNFVVLLSAVMGIGASFTIFWFFNLGARFENLPSLLGAGLVAGPPVGVLCVAVLALVHSGVSRIMGGKGTYRSAFAICAYSAAPIVYTVVFILPVEVALFGIYFFDKNPHPLVINPVAYVVLVGLDALALGWSIVLLAIGTKVATGLRGIRSFVVTCAVTAVPLIAGVAARIG